MDIVNKSFNNCSVISKKSTKSFPIFLGLCLFIFGFVGEASSLNCPKGYIPIPGNSELGTQGFCVMQFEAKAWRDDMP